MDPKSAQPVQFRLRENRYFLRFLESIGWMGRGAGVLALPADPGSRVTEGMPIYRSV